MSVVNQIQLIGHVCHDKTDDGFILGGTASYSTIVARQLCDQISLLSSYGEDFLFENRFKDLGIDLTIFPAKKTTVFENIYHENGRTQYCLERAAIIPVDKDTLNSTADVIMLCLIDDELDVDTTALKAHTGIKGATIQGWLRSFESDGLVVAKSPSMSRFEGIDIVIFSDDDIKDLDDQFLNKLKEVVPIIAMTRGHHGADIFLNGIVHQFPSFEVSPVDLTGAGDVFSVSFLYEYTRTRDISLAASFAHAAASLSIEGKGVESIPQMPAILERQSLYSKRYL